MSDIVSIVLNHGSIVADVVEGEAVIINVATGIYYSTDGIGGWIWESLAAGAPLAAIETTLAAMPEATGADVAADLDRFVDEMIGESLVIPGPATSDAPLVAPAIAYAAPTLSVYRDMTDLMALDPPMPMLDPPVR